MASHAQTEDARPRRAALAGLLLLLLGGLLLLPGSPAAAQALKPFTLKTLDGTPRSLTDLLGRATLIVFFYPTCRYCNLSFPALQRAYDAYQARGLSMVWINVLREEERLIERWQAKHGYTVPVLVGATLRRVQEDYGVSMTPTHYLLDAQGTVVWKHAGYRPGDEKTLEQQIRNVLGEAP